jgi:hypothetical protein
MYVADTRGDVSLLPKVTFGKKKATSGTIELIVPTVAIVALHTDSVTGNTGAFVDLMVMMDVMVKLAGAAGIGGGAGPLSLTHGHGGDVS